MGSIDAEARKALDLRLARGDISTREYYRLKAVLTLSARAASAELVSTAPQEKPIFIFEDLTIYASHLLVAGRRREISEIRWVNGGGVDLRINLWPTIKHTHLSIGFENGDLYELREERAIRGCGRHKSITQALHFLNKLTFDKLLHTLISDVRAGPVLIGVENEAPINSILGYLTRSLFPRKFAPIFLRHDGTITNGRLTLNLQNCRRDGVLQLGIHRSNLREPQSVYASDRKSVIELSHESALRFELSGTHRADVVMGLLSWMADPNNGLTSTSGR